MVLPIQDCRSSLQGCVYPLLTVDTAWRVPCVGNTDDIQTAATGQNWTGVEPLKHRLNSLLSDLPFTTIGALQQRDTPALWALESVDPLNTVWKIWIRNMGVLKDPLASTSLPFLLEVLLLTLLLEFGKMCCIHPPMAWILLPNQSLPLHRFPFHITPYTRFETETLWSYPLKAL